MIQNLAERVLNMEAKLCLQADKSLENKILVKIRKLRAWQVVRKLAKRRLKHQCHLSDLKLLIAIVQDRSAQKKGVTV
jgi:hypothetical protein